VDKFSTVSHSIISGLTMPSCSHNVGLATKIPVFVGVPVIMNHRVVAQSGLVYQRLLYVTGFTRCA